MTLKSASHLTMAHLLTRVKNILQHHPNKEYFLKDLNFYISQRLNTCLFSAVHLGQIQLVEQLIHCGADVSYLHQDLDEYHGDLERSLYWYLKSPLNIALLQDNYDIAEILLKANANIHLALHYEVRTYCKEKEANQQLCKKNIQFFLEKGADVNYKAGIYHSTALTCYANNLDKNITQILLKAGADVNIQDSNGFTPLHRAVQYHTTHAEMIWLLLQAGAYVNVYDKFGYNAFALCTLTNQKINMLLFAAGDKPDHPIIKERFSYDFQLFQTKINKNTLKNKCRNVIRNHLLNLDHVNLFVKVPKLPLKSDQLKSFLLYKQDRSLFKDDITDTFT